MMNNIPLVLSIWGAAISTILALIKIWEVYRDRMRLVVSYAFDSRPEEGNKIIIANPSATPVMIQYWELLWVKKRFGIIPQTYNETFPDDDYCNLTIQAHSKDELIFRDMDYFDWGYKSGKGRLYLKLHIIGRKFPLKKFVYDFEK